MRAHPIYGGQDEPEEDAPEEDASEDVVAISTAHRTCGFASSANRLLTGGAGEQCLEPLCCVPVGLADHLPFYGALGFEPTGEWFDGEKVYRLPIGPGT